MTMTTKTTQAPTLKIDRVFHATPERLWAFWTDPKKYAKWFNPAPIDLVIHEFDVRPGGKIRFDMPQPDGNKNPQEGVFHSLTPYTEIVSGAPDRSFLLVARFEPVDDARTRLVVEVTGVPPEYHAMATTGWNQGFDKLAREGKLTPYCSPNFKDYRPEALSKDCTHMYFTAYYQYIAYNPELVKPNEVPQTFGDLLRNAAIRIHEVESRDGLRIPSRFPLERDGDLSRHRFEARADPAAARKGDALLFRSGRREDLDRGALCIRQRERAASVGEKEGPRRSGDFRSFAKRREDRRRDRQEHRRGVEIDERVAVDGAAQDGEVVADPHDLLVAQRRG
mgnify:CR=1 FL=1